MTRRSIVMMSVIAIVALTVAYVGYGHVKYEILRHTKITIQGRPSPSIDIEQVRGVSRRLQAVLQNAPSPATSPTTSVALSPVDSAQQVDALTATTASYSITGAQFLAQLERQVPLTVDERSNLSRVFKIAANMQPSIDAEPSPDHRLAYQQQLIDSLRLRFKLILKDESRIAMARATLRGLPRISSDT